MRALVVVGVLFCCGAFGSASASAAEPGCFVGDAPLTLGPGYRAGLDALRTLDGTGPGEGGHAIAALLGDQYGGVWLEPQVDGWGVGLAPGPLDLAAARALIEQKLTNELPADRAAAAKAGLDVAPQPYSWADLAAVQDQVVALATAPGAPVIGGSGVGCTLTRAFRVEVTLFDPTSAQDETRARALLAPFGDRVVITRVAGPGPVPTTGLLGGPTSPAHPQRPVDPAPPLPKGGDGAPSAATVRRRATRSGSSLRVRVTCPKTAPTACAGTVTVRLKPRTGTGARLARTVFDGLAPGAERTFAVSLTRRQRAALARRRPATVTAAIRTGSETGTARRLDLG